LKANYSGLLHIPSSSPITHKFRSDVANRVYCGNVSIIKSFSSVNVNKKIVISHSEIDKECNLASAQRRYGQRKCLNSARS
jgi:hypothetical protein